MSVMPVSNSYSKRASISAHEGEVSLLLDHAVDRR
jgi:hypothetical protein